MLKRKYGLPAVTAAALIGILLTGCGSKPEADTSTAAPAGETSKMGGTPAAGAPSLGNPTPPAGAGK